MVRSIYDKSHFDDILLTRNNACPQTLARTKIQIKAWYRILSTERLSHEEYHLKITQISEQNENSPDSLASNILVISYN